MPGWLTQWVALLTIWANGSLAAAEISRLPEGSPVGQWARRRDDSSPRDVAEGRVLLVEFEGGVQVDTEPDQKVLRLHWAIRRGDASKVKSLLINGTDPNEPIVPGETPPLWRAAYLNESEIVSILIESGADLDGVNANGTTALYAAAQQGNVEVVRILLEAGADANSRSLTGATPLIVAASEGKRGVLLPLLRAGAYPHALTRRGKQSAVFIAAIRGHADIVRLLLAESDVRLKDLPDETGATPLYAASAEGHKDTVEALLEFSADLDKKREDGSVPLHGAAGNCRLRIVEILVKAGADRGVMNHKGKRPFDVICLKGNDKRKQEAIENSLMPLLWAVQTKNVSLVSGLIAKGEDVNDFIQNGTTLLEIAVETGQQKIVKSLLTAGAEPNKEDFMGNSPLHIAVASGASDIATALLVAGADVNDANTRNETGLHMSVRNEDVAMIQALKPFDPNPNIQDIEGTTPLHVAVTSGNLQVVSSLLELGADPDIQNDMQETPIQIARREGFSDMVSMLLDSSMVAREQEGIVDSSGITALSEDLGPRPAKEAAETAGAAEIAAAPSSTSSAFHWIIPVVLVPIVVFPAVFICFAVRKRRNVEEIAKPSAVYPPEGIPKLTMSSCDERWTSMPGVGVYQNDISSQRAGEMEAWKMMTESLSSQEISCGPDGKCADVPSYTGEHGWEAGNAYTVGADVLVSPRDMASSPYLASGTSDQHSSSHFLGVDDMDIIPPADSGSAALDDEVQEHERSLRSGGALAGQEMMGWGLPASEVEEGSPLGHRTIPSIGSSQVTPNRRMSLAGSLSVASWLQSERSESVASYEPSIGGSTVDWNSVQPPTAMLRKGTKVNGGENRSVGNGESRLNPSGPAPYLDMDAVSGPIRGHGNPLPCGKVRERPFVSHALGVEARAGLHPKEQVPLAGRGSNSGSLTSAETDWCFPLQLSPTEMSEQIDYGSDDSMSASYGAVTASNQRKPTPGIPPLPINGEYLGCQHAERSDSLYYTNGHGVAHSSERDEQMCHCVVPSQSVLPNSSPDSSHLEGFIAGCGNGVPKLRLSQLGHVRSSTPTSSVCGSDEDLRRALPTRPFNGTEVQNSPVSQGSDGSRAVRGSSQGTQNRGFTPCQRGEVAEQGRLSARRTAGVKLAPNIKHASHSRMVDNEIRCLEGGVVALNQIGGSRSPPEEASAQISRNVHGADVGSDLQGSVNGSGVPPALLRNSKSGKQEAASPRRISYLVRYSTDSSASSHPRKSHDCTQNTGSHQNRPEGPMSTHSMNEAKQSGISTDFSSLFSDLAARFEALCRPDALHRQGQGQAGCPPAHEGFVDRADQAMCPMESSEDLASDHDHGKGTNQPTQLASHSDSLTDSFHSLESPDRIQPRGVAPCVADINSMF